VQRLAVLEKLVLLPDLLCVSGGQGGSCADEGGDAKQYSDRHVGLAQAFSMPVSFMAV
jgi:hypothetical protein